MPRRACRVALGRGCLASWSRRSGCRCDGEEVSLELALSELQGSDRDHAAQAAEAISTALEPGARTLAFIHNTLIYEKSVDDRLRSYPHWLASRNLANEASDESVLALIHAVRGRFDIPQRWYRLKARLLGIDRLSDYDRSAPILEEEALFSFGEARELVLDTYDSFSPKAGADHQAILRRASGSTRRSGRTSAAGPSALTRCRASTRT